MDAIDGLFSELMTTLEKIRDEQPCLYRIWKHYLESQKRGLRLLSSQLNHVVHTTEKKELPTLDETTLAGLFAYSTIYDTLLSQ